MVSKPGPERQFAKLFDEGFDRLDALFSAGVSRSAGRLWSYLGKNCDRRTNALVASRRALADALEVDERTVSRASAELEKMGAIVTFKMGNIKCYALNPREIMRRRDDFGVVWAFDTRALVGRAENEAIMVKLKAAFPQSWEDE